MNDIKTISGELPAHLKAIFDKHFQIEGNFHFEDEAERVVVDKSLCEKHGLCDHNVYIFSDGYKKYKCLTCQRELEAKEEEASRIKAEEEKQRQEEEYIKYCKECNVEPEYYNFEFSDYKPKSETQRKALTYTKKLVEEKHGKLVLLGSTGVGKTALASIAAKKLHGKILTMYEITTMIRQSYTSKATKTELEIVEELASIPFLAIDELGRTKGSDAEINWLSYVLDKRHTRHLPFMLLSNSHFTKNCPHGGCPKCFENFIDVDVLSRLREDSCFVVIEGPDNRGHKNKE